MLAADLEEFVRRVRAEKNATLEGLSTHFANIEDTTDHSYADAQLARFEEALATVERLGGRPPIVHTACTAAAILFPNTHFTMLRTGIGLYGLWPSRETRISARERAGSMPDLRPVLSWKTRLVQVKELPAASYVGYGCSYRTTRRTRVGVLPVGYSDGYDRALGNRAHVLVRGRRAPVIGRICMNLCMADVTDVPDARLDDEVVLLGTDGDEAISAETMAEWAGTINYEVVSRINPLLPRDREGLTRRPSEGRRSAPPGMAQAPTRSPPPRIPSAPVEARSCRQSNQEARHDRPEHAPRPEGRCDDRLPLRRGLSFPPARRSNGLRPGASAGATAAPSGASARSSPSWCTVTTCPIACGPTER